MSPRTTIAALKISVDSMNDIIVRRNEKDLTSMEQNNKHMSSIKKSLTETQNLISSVKKPSYADVAKRSQRQRGGFETPRSSKAPKVNNTETPVLSGKSTKVIGKALSPIQPKRNTKPRIDRKTAEKAIWVSKLHRDTSVGEVLSYIRDDLGISVEQLEVRKLVKKDRDISEYSFISFCIACPANLFETLMDENKWPSNSQIREFKMTSNPSTGAKLNEKSPSKNAEGPTDSQVQSHQNRMETV